jgi:hypothetical protein
MLTSTGSLKNNYINWALIINIFMAAINFITWQVNQFVSVRDFLASIIVAKELPYQS